MVTPSGIFSVPVNSLATMLSECTSFQTFTAADDATEALTFIYPFISLTPDELPFTRPFGLIYLGDDFVNTPYTFTNGVVQLVLEKDIDEEYLPFDSSSGSSAKYRDAMYTFSNETGAIIAELLEKSLCGGALMISTIRSDSPTTSGFQLVQQGVPYMQQTFTITYGVK